MRFICDYPTTALQHFLKVNVLGNRICEHLKTVAQDSCDQMLALRRSVGFLRRTFPKRCAKVLDDLCVVRTFDDVITLDDEEAREKMQVRFTGFTKLSW